MRSSLFPARMPSLASKLGRLRFLKSSIPSIGGLLVTCFLLGVLVWSQTFLRITQEEEQLQAVAKRDASIVAGAYARHVEHALEQIDQITQILASQYQDGGRPAVEKMLRVSLLPPSLFNLVLVLDRHGNVVASSIPLMQRANFSERAYFQFHQHNNSSALRIGSVMLDPVLMRDMIPFSRSLAAADGRFDGVVLVAVEPTYFSSFYDLAGLGRQGMLTVVGADRQVRMISVGGVSQARPERVWRTVPALDGGDAPLRLNGRQWFVDGQSRYVSWQPVNGFPLSVLSGLSEDELRASHLTVWDNYRRIGTTCIAFLALLAAIGSGVLARLAWRASQADEIKATYRIATEGGNEGFYRATAVYGKDRCIVDFVIGDCNERGAAFLGRTRSNLIGVRLTELYNEAHAQALLAIFRRAMESGFQQHEFKIPRNQPLAGTWMHRKLVRSGDGLAVTLRDISDVKAHEAELARMANEDALTTLPNRHWMMHFLPGAVEQARQRSQALAILFMDLNAFKFINDTFGHAVGDELLRNVALRVKGALRPDDHVVRFGGDEFTIILNPIADRDEVVDIVKRILSLFGRPFDLSCGTQRVGASVGISLFPEHGDSPDALLRHADTAMYACKGQESSCYQFFDSGLYQQTRIRRDTEQALVRAVEDDEFELLYQPRIDVRSGRLRSMEALVRWRHPQRGLLLPADFIALAERNGTINKLGELIIGKACAQLADWRARHLPLVPVSINISAKQLRDGSLEHHFLDALSRYRLDAVLLEIEINESSMLKEGSEINAQLASLRAFGIRLAVDDFGTGYSSLAQLQRLDMDVLKVDQEITAALGTSEDGAAFFKAIVSMAHALGMSVVAEGVETYAQLQSLQSMGCDEIQGYYVSPPPEAEEMTWLMESPEGLESEALAV